MSARHSGSANTDQTACRPVAAAAYFLPVSTRVPLKFGTETLRSVTCLRVRVTVENRHGGRVDGWGETPLSVQWAWPSTALYETRHVAMREFSLAVCEALTQLDDWGHPLELGHDFLEHVLPAITERFNAGRAEPIPYLAALICASAADLALHDAYGNLFGCDIYQTYGSQHVGRDLAAFLEPAEDAGVSFAGRYVADYLTARPPTRLPAWHLVGGLDPLSPADLTGDEPDDGYPVLLRDWISADGLKCLKIKLRGNDTAWDYNRLVRVGRIANETGVTDLSADFNCTVQDCEYVNDVLDRLQAEHPAIYDRILYVEQPFPYDLEKFPLDVRSVSGRKALFLDESAHDWRFVRLGRSLGWTGVALKTCKTQTGALLSLCWAKAHGMPLMVQDLTNPMLAQIPHVRLAAQAGTIRGVETNGMQFYPDASAPEAAVHPGLYRRRGGEVDLSTLGGPGFGYQLSEIVRNIPEPAGVYQRR